MKIATVTLNPAIDQTVRVDQFQANSVNRAQAMQFDPGGKGVNVASYLADYGLEVAATGFLGQENPRTFEALFQRKGIGDYFVRIPGRTRTNVKIVDEAKQQTTDINMRGATPDGDAIHQLYRVLERLADEYAWFVLTGSLPPAVPEAMYAALITQIKSHGARVVLDTSGAALQEAVFAVPNVIKPNIHELEQLVGKELPDLPAVHVAAQQLLEGGIELVVVSLGERGALFADPRQTLLGVPPAVTVKSTVGAGDAMVAGLLAARAEGLDLAGAAQLATAFAVGAITRVGAHLPPPAALGGFVRRVKVSPVAEPAPSAVSPGDGAKS